MEQKAEITKLVDEFLTEYETITEVDFLAAPLFRREQAVKCRDRFIDKLLELKFEVSSAPSQG